MQSARSAGGCSGRCAATIFPCLLPGKYGMATVRLGHMQIDAIHEKREVQVALTYSTVLAVLAH